MIPPPQALASGRPTEGTGSSLTWNENQELWMNLGWGSYSLKGTRQAEGTA